MAHCLPYEWSYPTPTTPTHSPPDLVLQVLYVRLRILFFYIDFMSEQYWDWHIWWIPLLNLHVASCPTDIYHIHVLSMVPCVIPNSISTKVRKKDTEKKACEKYAYTHEQLLTYLWGNITTNYTHVSGGTFRVTNTLMLNAWVIP